MGTRQGNKETHRPEDAQKTTPQTGQERFSGLSAASSSDVARTAADQTTFLRAISQPPSDVASTTAIHPSTAALESEMHAINYHPQPQPLHPPSFLLGDRRRPPLAEARLSSRNLLDHTPTATTSAFAADLTTRAGHADITASTTQEELLLAQRAVAASQARHHHSLALWDVSDFNAPFSLGRREPNDALDLMTIGSHHPYGTNFMWQHPSVPVSRTMGNQQDVQGLLGLEWDLNPSTFLRESFPRMNPLLSHSLSGADSLSSNILFGQGSSVHHPLEMQTLLGTRFAARDLNPSSSYLGESFRRTNPLLARPLHGAGALSLHNLMRQGGASLGNISNVPSDSSLLPSGGGFIGDPALAPLLLGNPPLLDSAARDSSVASLPQGSSLVGLSDQSVPDPSQLAMPKNSTSKSGQNVEQFPQRLHRLITEVDEVGRSDIISFTADGQAFQIHKPELFFRSIVPSYFKQTQSRSFKKQLNLYGFERIARGPYEGGYYHEDFVRDRPELARKIRRTESKSKSSKKPSRFSCTPDFYSMPPITSAEVDAKMKEADTGGESHPPKPKSPPK